MHKVVAQGPSRHRDPFKKHRQESLPYELLLKNQPVRSPREKYPWPSSFGPLNRWLQSRVGDAWTDIYSELCAVVHPDSTSRVWLKQRVLGLVIRRTFMRGDTVWCYQPSWRGESEVPADNLDRDLHRFYVHPQTGCLCRVPEKPRKETIVRDQFGLVWIRSDVALRKAHGGWFYCFVEVFQEERQKPGKYGPVLRYDCVQQRKISRHEACRLYWRSIYFPNQRQLSNREMRQLGLVDNSAGLDRISRVIVNFFRALQSRYTEFVIN